VVPGDRWLLDNFGSVPADETELSLAPQPGHLAGSTLIGSAITVTRGIYPAELQAIARALAIFPLGMPLHVHSDSQSSIRSIDTFITQPNERRRTRSAARTILRLIGHLLRLRHEVGGYVTFSHVRAHTNNMDQHSVGNRMADFEANVAHQHADRSYPLHLRQLPLEELEAHLHVKDCGGLVVIDDLRRASRDLIKGKIFVKWQSKVDLVAQYAHVCTSFDRKFLSLHSSCLAISPTCRHSKSIFLRNFGRCLGRSDT
jgi:ribonuclease HI